MVQSDFGQKIKISRCRWPGYCGIALDILDIVYIHKKSVILDFRSLLCSQYCMSISYWTAFMMMSSSPSSPSCDTLSMTLKNTENGTAASSFVLDSRTTLARVSSMGHFCVSSQNNIKTALSTLHLILDSPSWLQLPAPHCHEYVDISVEQCMYGQCCLVDSFPSSSLSSKRKTSWQSAIWAAVSDSPDWRHGIQTTHWTLVSQKVASEFHPKVRNHG